MDSAILNASSRLVSGALARQDRSLTHLFAAPLPSGAIGMGSFGDYDAAATPGNVVA
jgi:hypothetical protein